MMIKQLVFENFHKMTNQIWQEEPNKFSKQLELFCDPQFYYFWRYLLSKKSEKNINRFMSKNQVKPTVQNVVSFAKLEVQGGADLELKLIAEKVSGSRYNKKRFPAVILRKTKPRSTILIFKSGRMIIIGSQSEQDAEVSAKKIAGEVKKLTNKKLKLNNFKVTNIVANADLGYKIDIGKLAQNKKTHKDDSFPGAVYHMETPVKAVLIFSSGKVVFTGAQKRDQIDEAFKKLLEDMKPYYQANKQN